MGIRLLSQQRPTGGGGGGAGGDLNDLGDVSVPAPTDEYVLAWNESGGLWEAVAADTPTLPLTTKGDLLGYSTLAARTPVGGTQGHVLTVDSGEALGVKWAVAPGAGGGSWTDVVLGTDFDTQEITQQDSGLGFTPAASKTYEFYALLLIRTTSASYGVCPGILWPSAGVADGAAFVDGARTYTGHTWKNVTGGDDDFALVTGHSASDTSFLQRIVGTLVTNGSISGDLDISIHMEATSSNTVTLRAGSLLKYREIA